jgi:hypothetical protein
MFAMFGSHEPPWQELRLLQRRRLNNRRARQQFIQYRIDLILAKATDWVQTWQMREVHGWNRQIAQFHILH